MRIVNENYENITMDDVDLEKGYLGTAVVIREDAEPIDDVKKFAWADDDYEEVQLYILYTDDTRPVPQEPENGDSVWDELDAAYREGVDSV